MSKRKSIALLPHDGGRHNSNIAAAQTRLMRGGTYNDLSTICLVPVPKKAGVPPRVLNYWFGLMPPMNQKFVRLFIEGHEVGEAYSQAIDGILGNPDLSKFKYVLTMEWDNCPPPDGLLKLYESIEGKVDGKKYDAVGGLYWTKGEMGQPMIYGDPTADLTFVPQLPRDNQVQPCRGLGMGFTLFRLAIFKRPDLPRPFFKTLQEWTPGVGGRAYTQDLYFFENAGKLGLRFASDNRVKVGHYDFENEVMW